MPLWQQVIDCIACLLPNLERVMNSEKPLFRSTSYEGLTEDSQLKIPNKINGLR